MNTMAKFMRYIACTGQIKMATIGYSPLPTQLSQFLANAIGYMTGQPAEQLTGSNCANPQFQGGSLGVGATPPADPTASVKSEAPASKATTTVAGTTTSGTPTAQGTTGTQTTSGPTGTSTAPAGVTGVVGSTTKSAGGGTTSWLPPAPVAYVGPLPKSGPPWPLLALLLLLLVPVVLLTLGGRRRRAAGAAVRGADPVNGAGPAGEGSGPR